MLQWAKFTVACMASRIFNCADNTLLKSFNRVYFRSTKAYKKIEARTFDGCFEVRNLDQM